MSMTKVQVKTNSSGGATSLTLSGTQGWASSTAGNLLVVMVNCESSTNALTFTDNLGSTYTLDYSFQTNRIKFYSLPNNPGGVTSFTVSNVGFDALQMSAWEFSGAATTSPFDTSAAGSDGGFGVGSWATNTTGTTGSAGGIVLTVAYDWREAAATLTIGTAGYTNDVADQWAGGSLYAWEKADAGSSTYSASGSGGSGSGQIIAAIVVYKAGGGAPPPSGGLFLPAQLAGLGSGGPFFQNPLN